MLTVYNIDDGSDLRRGKVASLLLPQEDLLERLVALIHNKPKCWRTTKKGWFGRVKKVSVCTWEGVVCDEAQTITRLLWTSTYGFYLRGALSWPYLPKSLHHGHVVRQRGLQGNITEIQYPSNLISLTAGHSSFSGTLDLTHLPPTLLELKLQKNHIHGGLDFSALPLTLRVLLLHGNRFTGSVQLDNLPGTLQRLQLDHNFLEGELDLKNLLESKNQNFDLDVRYNQFSSYAPNVTLPGNVRYLPQRMQETSDDSSSGSSSYSLSDSMTDLHSY